MLRLFDAVLSDQIQNIADIFHLMVQKIADIFHLMVQKNKGSVGTYGVVEILANFSSVGGAGSG